MSTQALIKLFQKEILYQEEKVKLALVGRGEYHLMERYIFLNSENDFYTRRDMRTKTLKAFNNFVPSYDKQIVSNHNAKIYLSVLNIPTLPNSIADEILESAQFFIGKVHKFNGDVFYVHNKDNENQPRSSVYH